MGVPQAGLRQNALCSLAILGAIVAIAVGLPALDRAVAGTRALASGIPYAITDRVTVVPPPGAALDLTGTRPGAHAGQAVFVLGRVRIAVLVSGDRLSLDRATYRLLRRLRDSIGADPIAGPGGPLLGLSTDEARAGRFHAPQVDGWYAVRLLRDGTVVDVTASGRGSELIALLPAIEATAASVAGPP